VAIGLASGAGDWISAPRASSGVSFRHARRDLALDWHPAARRQYVITLAGEVEYEIHNGERRRFGPGSVFLADDVGGEGHVSRGVGLVDRTSVYIPVDADETLPTSTRIASSVRER
jgi:hypothetical protein